MTVRLWGVIQTPPDTNSIYRRTLAQNRPLWKPTQRGNQLSRNLVVFTLLLMLLAGMYAPVILVVNLIDIPVVFIVVVYSLLWLFLTFGQLLIGLWAARISNEIATSRTISLYDVLCVTPYGKQGVDWSLGMGALWRSASFDRVYILWDLLRLTGGMLGIIILTLMFVLDFQHLASLDHVVAITARYVGRVSIVTILIADFPQSVVLSVVIGLWMPLRVQSRLDARLGTVGIYFVIQMAMYVIAALIGLLILPVLFDHNGLSREFGSLLSAPLALLVLLGGREYIIRVLWRRLGTHDGAAWLNIEEWIETLWMRREDET